MPKPTRAELERVYTTAGPGDSLAVDALMYLIDVAWLEDEDERRGLRWAQGEIARLADWILANVPGELSRNEGAESAVDAAIRLLRERFPSVASEPETVLADIPDVEEFNRLQRERRIAYAQGLNDADKEHGIGDAPNAYARSLAASHYPLKKREPRIMPDPHPYDAGQWCIVNLPTRRVAYRSSPLKKWSLDGEFPCLTEDRLRALVALLDSPFTYVDDTTPEQEST